MITQSLKVAAMRGKTPPTEPLTSGERRKLVIGALVGVVVLAVGVTAWELAGARSVSYDKSRDGCVNVYAAGFMGGGLQHECGQAARTWCAAAYQMNDSQSLQVQRQCGLAGIARQP
jgi:hypothetical protein